MENYTQYSIEDFIQDPHFRQWVLDATLETTNFWEQYRAENPTQKENIDVARAMVMGITIKDIPVDAERMHRNINNILSATKVETVTPMVPLSRKIWFSAAAVVALLVVAGLWWAKVVNTERQVKPEQEVVASANVVTPIVLPDGSRVTLEKNSRLTYDKDFKGDVRTVYLEGEAFFEVVKNPNKPFVVYANNLVTKVLGTSFRIKAFPKENVTVNVVTGRVSVFAHKKETNKQKDPETDGLILTPNQKVVFTEEDDKLKRSLIEAPVVIIPQEALEQMVFEEAPVTTILKAVQEAYGVEIVYDEDNMQKCALTVRLRNETLFDKLTVICKSIGATYKVVDAQVIIEGGDCN